MKNKIIDTLKGVINAKYQHIIAKGADKMAINALLSFIDPVQYRNLRYSCDNAIIHFGKRHKTLYLYINSNYYININNKALLMIKTCYYKNENYGYETSFDIIVYTKDMSIVKYLCKFLFEHNEEVTVSDTDLMVIERHTMSDFRYFENIPCDKLIIYRYKKDIYDKLGTFINTLDMMYQLSLTPRIGFLFHGEPGTGKTKVALQMIRQIFKIYEASMFRSSENLKLFYSARFIYIDAGDIDVCIRREVDIRFMLEKYSMLKFQSNKMKASNSRKIPFVLIDEIDLIVPNRNSDEYAKNKKLYDQRLSFLLQLLEMPGIFVATTNHIENLDPALIRTGRLDYKYEFTYFDHDEACQLCDNYGLTPEECGIKEDSSNIPPSDLAVDILNVLKKKTIQGEVV